MLEERNGGIMGFGTMVRWVSWGIPFDIEAKNA
jgi:hypothetical protein